MAAPALRAYWGGSDPPGGCVCVGEGDATGVVATVGEAVGAAVAVAVSVAVAEAVGVAATVGVDAAAADVAVGVCAPEPDVTPRD